MAAAVVAVAERAPLPLALDFVLDGTAVTAASRHLDLRTNSNGSVLYSNRRQQLLDSPQSGSEIVEHVARSGERDHVGACQHPCKSRLDLDEQDTDSAALESL